MGAPTPSHFIVCDLELGGLNKKPARDHDAMLAQHRWGLGNAHQPGHDADCILEVGFAVLDAQTLETLDEGWTAVTPPGVTTVAQFDAWAAQLKTYNAYVFDMHTKNGLLDFLRVHIDSTNRHGPAGGPRATMNETLMTVERVESDLITRLTKTTSVALSKIEPSNDGRTDLHQGNSPLVMVGNSIVNCDVPMLALWMPKLHDIFSYRVQDVSIMRMFYNDITRVALPGDLNEYIKTGGGKDVVHRALDDVQHCAKAFKRLVHYGRDVASDAAEYRRGGGS